jgi:uncharacterized protein YcnI
MTQASSEHPRRSRRRRGGAIFLAVVFALVPPAAAQAHISLHPNTIPAGAYATLDVRVPGEQVGAHVTKVDMLLPQGFTSLDYENVPGWTVSELRRTLAHPIRTEDGPIDQEVSQIIWTWTGPLGKVANGQFIDFPLSVAIPSDAAGSVLKFKAVQTYSNGRVVYWIEPALDDQYPAPRVDITPRGGLIEDVAGAEAGPTPGQAGAPAATRVAGSSGAASQGLVIAAIVVGALGLAAGLCALRFAFRPPPRRSA